MDRPIVYEGQLPRTLDILQGSKSVYVGLSKMIEALIGLNASAFGLSCTPNSPANLTVLIAPGQLYQSMVIDTTAYGDISTDAHNILKQGLLLDQLTLNCAAPITSGYSINYLIQAKVTESDANSVVLSYFNASDINTPLSGPGGTSVSQYTLRQNLCTVSAKAGSAAATGTQTTPAPDSGYVPLYVVTVAYGQTTIISGNIVLAANNPFVTMYSTRNLATAFPSSLVSNGYQKLPGGLILQWCVGASVSNETPYTVTFPIAFPNACLNVSLSTWDASTDVYGTTVFNMLSFNTTGVNLFCNFGGSTGGPWKPYIFAIGY